MTLGLVERDARSFQKRLDLGPLVVGTSSGATSWGGSERIGSPSSCTGSIFQPRSQARARVAA